jgi:addiction module HigA family antidote
MTHLLAPIHPGEVLADEFLAPLGVTQYRLAKDTSVPARRVNEIVKGLRSISADTALRLSRYFGTSELFWLNLQARYDLEVEKDRLGERLDAEVHIFDPPASIPRRARVQPTSAVADKPQARKVPRSGLIRKVK